MGAGPCVPPFSIVAMLNLRLHEGLTMAVDFFGDFLFHGPQIILAAIMYTLLARFLLSLIFAPNSEKVIWRTFETITRPFINIARFLTPRMVPDNLVVLFAFIWVLFARIGLFVAFSAAGLRPTVGA